MEKSKYEKHLTALGWAYSHKCGTCGGTKYFYRRGSDMMTVYPHRDFYQFTENGSTKSGKLSQLENVVKAAENAKKSDK